MKAAEIHPPDDYDRVVDLMKERFAALMEARAPLYATDVAGLFERFLDALPAESRQRYTCGTCRKFVERYGGLAVIDAELRLEPAMWHAGPEPKGDVSRAIEAMATAVREAKITGVFATKTSTLGTPEAGGWRHFSVEGAPEHQGRLTAGQAMALSREEYRMLGNGLAEFPREIVRKAHTMLRSGNLFRSEKCIGVAKWLLDLHEARRATTTANQRARVTWRALAEAPPGYCHVRSGMIGTLLEDLVAGLPFHTIKARFDAKMHPLQYQRPTAAPSAGNIAQAEKIVAELRTAGALERRFARLEDLDTLWRPQLSEAGPHAGATPGPTPGPTPERGPEGVFGHLRKAKTSASASVEMPAVTMTWDKFERTVLPEAAAIEYYAPKAKASYVAIVTAVDPEAPPIIQWDRLERRNPATFYVYVEGSRGTDWNLEEGAWHRVNAITYRPSMWYGVELSHQGQGAILVLEGCRDLRHSAGGGFFPEQLKSEYHAIRRTMEAYAAAAVIAGLDDATACGVFLQGGLTWTDARVRVTDRAGQVVVYALDRWD